jgi:1,4-dihydroxy-2-naphthoate octaprenyltransferase
MPQNSRNRQGKPSTASKKVSYSPLTPSLAFQLAAPHTWVAAIMPVLFSIEYSAITYSGKVSILLALILLAICILMQSAVNVLNDYFDFKKGTDSAENSSDDAFDAVLVYNNLNPKSVCSLAIGFLIVAAGMGFYLVYLTGWILLVIGLIGALIVFLYSGGKTPISYMPIGELVSGFVMGGLIPLACCYTLSGVFEPLVLLVALPFIFGIGMILFTNNTCDIEKDINAQRKTISVVLGRDMAPNYYHVAILVWIVLIAVLVGLFYPAGMPIVMIMVLAAFPVLRAILNNPLNQKTRDAAMSQIVMLNVILGAFYCLSLTSGSFMSWV